MKNLKKNISRLGIVTLFCFGLAARAAELSIDGISIGKTSCTEAIKTAYGKTKERDSKVNFQSEYKESQKILLRSILKKPKLDTSSYEILNNEYVQKLEKDDLEAYSNWQPTYKVSGYNCTLPGVSVFGSNFSGIFHLSQTGPVDLEALKIADCPYLHFFRASNQTGEAHNAPLVCINGIASFYTKVASVEYKKLKEELRKKYGRPQELETHYRFNLTADNSNLKEFFQLVTLYTTGNNHVILLNEALNEGPRAFEPEMFNSEKFSKISIPKNLKFNPTSEIYYFSSDLLNAVKKNKKTYEELAARQLKNQKITADEHDKKVLEGL